jgi:hypothetical protein
MAIVNHEHLEAKVVKKAVLREKKKKPKMKVSGSSVKSLQKLISER